jgi:hypothetical protein
MFVPFFVRRFNWQHSRTAAQQDSSTPSEHPHRRHGRTAAWQRGNTAAQQHNGTIAGQHSSTSLAAQQYSNAQQHHSSTAAAAQR